MQQLADLFPKGRQLVEIGHTNLDTVDGDRAVYLAGYTLAYSSRLRFSGNVTYAQSDPVEPAKNESGLGDSRLLLQFDPSAQLAANAFIPNTLGLTFGLQVPTGDHRKGLGEDLWAASLGLGWLVDFPFDFWLLPSLQHEWTLSKGSEAIGRERTDFGLGLYWLFPFKAWLGLEPVLAYDHRVNEDALDWGVTVGKVWNSGLGLDLRWIHADRLAQRGVRDDQILTLSISYQFGRPPK